MARVTVEDCIEVIPNRFHLILYATHRISQLQKNQPTVPHQGDKNSVIALREIAEQKIDLKLLYSSLVRQHQHFRDPLQEEIRHE